MLSRFSWKYNCARWWACVFFPLYRRTHFFVGPRLFQEKFNTCFCVPLRPTLSFMPIFARAFLFFYLSPIAVQSFLFTQKLTTIIGALGFWILLTWFDPTTAASSPLLSSSTTPDTAHAAGDLSSNIAGLSMVQGYSLFALMVVASGVLKLSALGWSISIERDWIVALCHSNSDALTRKQQLPPLTQILICTKQNSGLSSNTPLRLLTAY